MVVQQVLVVVQLLEEMVVMELLLFVIRLEQLIQHQQVVV